MISLFYLVLREFLFPILVYMLIIGPFINSGTLVANVCVIICRHNKDSCEQIYLISKHIMICF